jgi:hypothetical protein
MTSSTKVRREWRNCLVIQTVVGIRHPRRGYVLPPESINQVT